jgi:hypothetical protein
MQNRGVCVSLVSVCQLPLCFWRRGVGVVPIRRSKASPLRS